MFRNNRCYDRPMTYSSESMQFSSTNMNAEYPAAMPQVDASMNMGMCPMPMVGCQMPPVQECPQERVCHREIQHEVPQV